MPVLDGQEPVARDGDDRFMSVTVDLDPDALHGAARLLRAFAARTG